MQKLLVWDALIAWRDDILRKDVLRKSKIDYLSNMARLIERGLLNLEQPLSEFRKLNVLDLLQKIDLIQDWSNSTKQSRCILLRSFHKFAKSHKISSTDILIPFKEYRDLEKIAISELLSSNEIKALSQSLNDENIIQFLIELCHINPRDSLICWMMWEFKCTIHQILDIKIEDINFKNDVLKIKNEFRISPSGGIRLDLKKCILEQSKGKSDSDLLFVTKNGKRINSMQITRNMKTASKKAKLPLILTPKILYANAQVYAANAYLKISKNERQKLSNEYAKKIKLLDEKLKKAFAE